jgi:D-glycero-D-manno-heptose 1,7-bisphosphate phosphatase
MVKRRAVFLDRDGVLNASIVRGGKPYAPLTLAEFELLPGVPDALARLRAAGFLNVVVTNQPDVATGKARREDVDAIHAHLLKNLPIDAVKACFHTDSEGCDCRKPKPGMLLEAARELGIDLGASFMVGDRWRDVAAAHGAGCKALFIDYKYQEQQPEQPFLKVESLPDAAGVIVQAGR